MVITVREEMTGEWAVWVSMNNDTDPRDASESFIIGDGKSRDAAVHSARRELDTALEHLAAIHASPPEVTTIEEFLARLPAKTV